MTTIVQYEYRVDEDQLVGLYCTIILVLVMVMVMVMVIVMAMNQKPLQYLPLVQSSPCSNFTSSRVEESYISTPINHIHQSE
jgi:hypothetical protein